jgi:LysR family transcriptional regulator, transcriptional activator of nhaA
MVSSLRANAVAEKAMTAFRIGVMKVFAQAGEGYFPTPAIISEEICARYGVSEVGRLDEMREAFWLISTERRIQHPEVRALLEDARNAVFVSA